MPRINLLNDLTESEMYRLQSYQQTIASYKHDEQRQSGSKSKFGVFALLLKIGPKIVGMLAKMAKGLKVGKIGLAGASMASYAYMFTWEFAAMIMIMLFIHESGHIWAMKRYGIKTKGIYFLPFVGGAAVAEDAFPTRESEVVIALMGPLWGFALALLTGFAYAYTGTPIFAAAASWMGMVNLFNLLPINPLDGGRVMKSIAYSVHSKAGIGFLFVGLFASGFLAFKVGLGLFVFLFFVGTVDTLLEYRRRIIVPSMSAMKVLGSAVAYLVVAGMLWGLMTFMSHVPGADAAMELLKG